MCRQTVHTHNDTVAAAVAATTIALLYKVFSKTGSMQQRRNRTQEDEKT